MLSTVLRVFFFFLFFFLSDDDLTAPKVTRKVSSGSNLEPSPRGDDMLSPTRPLSARGYKSRLSQSARKHSTPAASLREGSQSARKISEPVATQQRSYSSPLVEQVKQSSYSFVLEHSNSGYALVSSLTNSEAEDQDDEEDRKDKDFDAGDNFGKFSAVFFRFSPPSSKTSWLMFTR